MIILDCFAMLLIAFIAHLIWWRISMPSRTTAALLVIFLATPLLLYVLGIQHFSFEDEKFTHARLLLLYISTSLVYVILYSAIEQQSPTLSMVNFLKQHQDRGCDDESLIAFCNTNNDISKRLLLMQQSGWVKYTNQRWHLTPSGLRVAKLFHTGANLFGLKVGG